MHRHLTVDIPEEVYDLLAWRARETGRTVEAVAAELLSEAAEDFIDRPADFGPDVLHPVPSRPTDPLLG
jgi:hypothetical protein